MWRCLLRPLCWLKLHDFENCLCVRCHFNRNDFHNWFEDACLDCGAQKETIKKDHTFCRNCGQEHNWQEISRSRVGMPNESYAVHHGIVTRHLVETQFEVNEECTCCHRKRTRPAYKGQTHLPDS